MAFSTDRFARKALHDTWREDAFAEDTRAEQAGSLARKTQRRPATARGGLNGAARRSSDGRPEPRFSRLRSPP